MPKVQIRRRIRDARKLIFKNIVESAFLISRTPKGAWVELSNGDQIHRKNKDII